MKRTVLVDGMHCIYDKKFKLNEELLDILNSFDANKILVVKKFRNKGKELTGFEAFSLEEEGIGKDNPEYFEKLIEEFNLNSSELVYFDHNQDSISTAKKLGIKSILFKDNNQIKNFLEANL